MCNDDVQKIFDLICSDYLHFLEINKLFGKDFISFAQSKLKKENIKDFDLTQAQEQFLIQSFLRRGLTFNSNTPKILLYNLQCIESSLNLDPRSSDFLPEDISSDGKKIAIKILSSKPFYLTQNSPQFLQADPLVASNSIQTSFSSANDVAWFSMSMNDTPKLVKQVIESGYILDEYSNDFLRFDPDVVVASLDRDSFSERYIPTAVMQYEKVLRKLILIDSCEYSDIYKTKFSFLRKYKDDSLVITKCFDIMDAYCSFDSTFRERFNQIVIDAICNFPSLQSFNDLFMYYAENNWNAYKNSRPEYNNVFNKICGELRHQTSYEDVEKNSLFSRMKHVLDSKYKQLEIAMKSYFEIFHNNDEENLGLLEEPKNIISNLSALYLSRVKETYKKGQIKNFYNILSRFYSLKLDHPYIRKQIIRTMQKKYFKELFSSNNDEVEQFISNLKDKYSDYFEENELFLLIRCFINFNDRKMSQIISSPAFYDDYIKYKKVLKLVHRLNSNYISIDGLEVRNYKHLISYNEITQEYFYSGVTFDSSEITKLEEFLQKEKIFKQIKRDIFDFTKNIPVDMDNIPSEIISNISKSIPLQDEYYCLDSNYYKSLTISNLSESFFFFSKKFKKDAFMDDDSYQILYDLLVNKGILWLLLFREEYNNTHTFFHAGLSEFNTEFVMQLITNMKKSVELSKNFHLELQTLDDIFSINQMLQYVDDRSVALLGGDIIKKISTEQQFTSNDSLKKVSMANDFVPRMLTRNFSTVPYVSGDTLHYHYATYDSQDMDYLLSGIDTYSCFRLDGNDNDFFHYCALNKNGVVLKITDKFGNLIARVSGFRYGNSVFFNQLRSIYDNCGATFTGSLKGERKDIIEAFQKACQDIVSISNNNIDDTEPIDFVFVTQSYMMIDYPNSVSDRIAYEIGEHPMDTVHENWFDFIGNTPNLDESKNNCFFSTDYGDYSIICMASSVKTIMIEKYDVPEIYQRKRNSIVITDDINNEIFIKVNRIKAAKSKLNEEKEILEGKFEPITISPELIFLVGDNWYIICNSYNVIDSCVLEKDKFALEEFNLVQSILYQFINENGKSQCTSVINQDVLEKIGSKIKIKDFRK